MSIPVFQLDANHVPALREHFHALGPEDRRLRFGQAIKDEQIDIYVNSIRYAQDAVFGVLGADLSLAGVAHLACGAGPAELGLSVLPEARGRGIGTVLFKRAAMHARNHQVDSLFMHFLAENDTILHIARKAGMQVRYDQSEANAVLALPPGNVATFGQELADQQWALFDWVMKASLAGSRGMLNDIIR